MAQNVTWIVEVQYVGETSWHYYASDEDNNRREDMEKIAEYANDNMPGKVRRARVVGMDDSGRYVN